MSKEDIREEQSEKIDSIVDSIKEEISGETNTTDSTQQQSTADENILEADHEVIDVDHEKQTMQGSKKDQFLQGAKKAAGIMKTRAANMKEKAGKINTEFAKEKAGTIKETADKLKDKSAVALKKACSSIKDKKAEKEEIKPDKVVLKPGEVKNYKLFFVSDMEEEAAYLHEMSLKGMHFVKKAGIQYVFQTGETKNYYYHLGYYEKDKRDGERYESNYAEAGWEKIYHEKGEFDGVWNYFRTEVENNAPEPHIFSDRISRIALYERLLSSWRTLLATMILCLLCMGCFLFFLNSKTGTVDSIFLIICITISIVILLIFAIYSRVYLKINKKLAELKK